MSIDPKDIGKVASSKDSEDDKKRSEETKIHVLLQGQLEGRVRSVMAEAEAHYSKMVTLLNNVERMAETLIENRRGDVYTSEETALFQSRLEQARNGKIVAQNFKYTFIKSIIQRLDSKDRIYPNGTGTKTFYNFLMSDSFDYYSQIMMIPENPNDARNSNLLHYQLYYEMQGKDTEISEEARAAAHAAAVRVAGQRLSKAYFGSIRQDFPEIASDDRLPTTDQLDAAQEAATQTAASTVSSVVPLIVQMYDRHKEIAVAASAAASFAAAAPSPAASGGTGSSSLSTPAAAAPAAASPGGATSSTSTPEDKDAKGNEKAKPN